MLWLRDAHLPLEERAPLVVAHDWHDAERRTPLALTEALDAFLEPPLDRVEIDLDIKLPGREEEVVDALRERGLIERAMVSTMEMHTLERILELEPGAAARLDLSQGDQGLDLEALGEAGDDGGAGGDAAPAPRPGGREAAEVRRRGDVGLPPADQRRAWRGSASSPRSS